MRVKKKLLGGGQPLSHPCPTLFYSTSGMARAARRVPVVKKKLSTSYAQIFLILLPRWDAPIWFRGEAETTYDNNPSLD